MKEEESSKGWIVCLVTIGIVVTIAIAVTVAFTVFKPKKFITTVDSIDVRDMDVNVNIFNMSLNLNVTLDVLVSVKNPNIFGLKYYDGFAQLNYRGEEIGEAPIPSGEISSKETKQMNVTLTIMADRILSNSQVISDVTSGGIQLNTFMRISGEVSILGLIKFHGNTTASCDFVINTSNKTIDSHVCQYKMV
ncbi:unnamed protein product [Trifolium pratense]|uniref:Uncharacterized protein n=1 Tax=Trifolium pratense TaxID=57577 RepID=A0ACB0LR62_TRIPR|nr:unnamed protein product [Trifolium pratense]